ncbi:MAG: branched-chain amino acid ABC transporter permease [Coprothermobacterota bacterium]|nr:branched-chain amino acid ABC transporter permease [Coprothermobacterota bacterium]
MMKNLRIVSLLFLVLLVLILPFFFRSNQYGMILLTTILLYGVLATAWNIIGGMAGQLDLAAGAYLGLGAFTTGTLLLRFNLTPWIGIFVGGLVAVLFAILVGLPLFRFKVKEVWYALSSSALVEVLRIAFIMWEKIGGPVERYLPSYGSALYMRFSSYIPYYYIMVILLFASLFVNYWISRSKLGYYLIALGDDEDAAEVLGVNVRSSKLKALVIYAFIVGLTGGVYACIYGFIHPNFFSSPLSTEVAILGIVGGMGITYGPLVGAVLLVSMRELLRANLGGQLESLYLVIYSVVLILIVLFRPRGITTLLQDTFNKVFSRWVRNNHAE